mgnify:CR=1 FL=1
MVHEAEVRRHVTPRSTVDRVARFDGGSGDCRKRPGPGAGHVGPAVTAMQSAPEPARVRGRLPRAGPRRVHAGEPALLAHPHPARLPVAVLRDRHQHDPAVHRALRAHARLSAHRLFRHRYGRMLVYFTLFTLVGFVLDFPLSWYSGFALEHQFNLSNQSFAKWLIDEGKGSLVGIVALGATGLIALAYAAIDKNGTDLSGCGSGSGRCRCCSSPCSSSRSSSIRCSTSSRRSGPGPEAGHPRPRGQGRDSGRNVYEVDKSQQTKKYNAYVNGFGPSQRIVLWDTTLKGMDHDEILFVMGHEMGHYKLLHLWKGVAFTFLLSFGLFFVSGKMMAWATARYGPRWGFTRLSDEASLPLFISAISLAALIAQPLSNAFSRRIEHEADTFGLEVTHSTTRARARSSSSGPRTAPIRAVRVREADAVLAPRRSETASATRSVITRGPRTGRIARLKVGRSPRASEAATRRVCWAAVGQIALVGSLRLSPPSWRRGGCDSRRSGHPCPPLLARAPTRLFAQPPPSRRGASSPRTLAGYGPGLGLADDGEALRDRGVEGV